MPQTKLHIQKCNTCRDTEQPNFIIRVITMIQYTEIGQDLSSATETVRQVRRKLTHVCDSWFLGCNRGVLLNCTPYAIQHPLMRLRFHWFFVFYLLWFGALLLGWNEGKVLPRTGIFQTSWVNPAPDVCRNLKIKLRKRRCAQSDCARPQTAHAIGRGSSPH